jgi:hypothetical protein
MAVCGGTESNRIFGQEDKWGPFTRRGMEEKDEMVELDRSGHWEKE